MITASPTPDPFADAFASAAAGPHPGGALRFPARGAPDAEDLDTDEPGERAIWLLHRRYILTPIRSGLLVVDQQAAHERILYERALTAMEGGLAASQQLLFPQAVELDPADHALLTELLRDLRSLGFELEPMAGRTVLVRGVPTEVRVGTEKTILEDLFDAYRRHREGLHVEGREGLARALARRSALRPGHALKPAEARSLIDQLFACREPETDPAGRPTMIRLPADELERRFARRT